MLRAGFFCIALTLLLAGCAPQQSRPAVIGTADGTQSTLPLTPQGTQMAGADGMTYVPRDGAPVAANAGTLREPVRVAILVPQSGPNAALGESLMQAAQLAVFDLNEPNFQLVPKDTKGTAEGTRQAVDEAAREGVKLILGPVFAQEVEAAKTAARNYGLTVIGFSTDWRLAGDNVFTMGVLPFGQAQRIADYAARQGWQRIAAVATKDMYGDAVLAAFEKTAKSYGLTIAKTVRIAADGSDAANAVQELTDGKATVSGATPYDAIFMPIGGPALHSLALMLKTYGMGTANVKYLGTGLWDDGGITGDINMSGALYAAPSPQIRAAFERNYQRIYGTTPPRLASIGYDAAALAIVLARNATAAGQRVAYDRASLTNPNGFSGVDGIFRFRGDGLAERGMAILQVAPGGQVRMIEPAPASFQQTAR